MASLLWIRQAVEKRVTLYQHQAGTPVLGVLFQTLPLFFFLSNRLDQREGQLGLVSTQLACTPHQYVCGLLLPFHLFMVSPPTLKFSLNTSYGHDNHKYTLHSTLALSLQSQTMISWAQQHWGTGSVLVVFVTLLLSHRAHIFLLPSSLTFLVFLLCVVPAGCPWSLPACQAQHTAPCSKAYGQQNKELAAGIWMWHILNCFKNQGMR